MLGPSPYMWSDVGLGTVSLIRLALGFQFKLGACWAQITIKLKAFTLHAIYIS